jgi:biopolymer transport protein ExbD
MLIIFFVLTTTFTVDKTPTTLPDSLSRKEAVQESALVLVHLEHDLSTGRPTKLHYRYSDGMLQSWAVTDPIDLTGDPSMDSAYARVRAEIMPILATDVRCTLNPADDAGDGRQCHHYLRGRNAKYPIPNTKQWNDMIRGLATKRFIIKADRKVPYRFVDPVIQTLRDNNAFEVFLLTEQKSG